MTNVVSNNHPGKIYDLSSPSKVSKKTTPEELEVGHPVGAEEQQEQGRKQTRNGNNNDEPSSSAANPVRERPGASGSSENPPRNNCSLALDILSTVFLLITAIFFIAAAIMMHPDMAGYYNFWLFGTIFFLPVACIDVAKRKTKGALEIHIASIGLLGGLLWFVASSFLFYETFDSKVWGLLWIFGSICQIYVITYDIVMFFRGETKSAFQICALLLAWIANILFTIGAAIFSSVEWFYFNYDSQYDSAIVLIVGSVFYLLYAIFATLGMFLRCNLFCTINISRSGAVEGGQSRDPSTPTVQGNRQLPPRVAADRVESRLKNNNSQAGRICPPCCSRLLDAFVATCLFASCLFFIIGAAHFTLSSTLDINRNFYNNEYYQYDDWSIHIECDHIWWDYYNNWSFDDDINCISYDDYNSNYTPMGAGSTYIYWLLGALLYLAPSSSNVFKTRTEGAGPIIASSFGLLGACFWILGTVFFNFALWSGLWVTGSVFHLIRFSIDFAFALKTKKGALTLHVFVAVTGFLANVLFTISLIWLISYDYGTKNNEKDWDDSGFKVPVYLLISASCMLSIHSIFYILTILLEHTPSKDDKNNDNEEDNNEGAEEREAHADQLPDIEENPEPGSSEESDMDSSVYSSDKSSDDTEDKSGKEKESDIGANVDTKAEISC